MVNLFGKSYYVDIDGITERCKTDRTIKEELDKDGLKYMTLTKENMYLMLSIFRYYNVIPIFVFDGKPPPEKKRVTN